MPAAGALTEAFLWSAHRTVTKTATVSLHGNTYQVEPALAGRKVELVFSPFNLEHIESATRQEPTERRCRTTSPATPTPKPDPRHPNRRRHRPPGSTTWRWSPTPTTGGSPPTKRINFDALYPQPDTLRPDGATPRATQHRRHPRSTTTSSVALRSRRTGRGHRMTVQRLQAHYGFTRMPFGRNLAPACCTATPVTAKRSPGSPGAWTNTPSG